MGKNSKRVRARQIKRFAVTWNNWEEDEAKEAEELDWITYGIMGREIAPVTGTKHLQCYFETVSKISCVQFSKRFESVAGCRVHVEEARGTLEENQDYCSKHSIHRMLPGSPPTN